MPQRHSQRSASRSWWEESSSTQSSPRVRRRDEWMQRIVGKVEKFQPPPEPEKPKPILVVDRSEAEDFTMLEKPRYKPGTFGSNVFVNALTNAMHEKKNKSKQVLEEIKRDMALAIKKQEEEKKRALIMERERLRRLNNGIMVGERDEGDDIGDLGSVPLELLPIHHPSHLSFRGLHPHFGNAQVRGYLPNTPSYSEDTASDFITRGPFLGNINLSRPTSAFNDANERQWMKNGTPIGRDSLGALPSRGTFTARQDGKRRRQRHAQILLGETNAGNALFSGQSLPQLPYVLGSQSTILDSRELYDPYYRDQPPPSSSLSAYSYDDRASIMSRRQQFRKPQQLQQSRQQSQLSRQSIQSIQSESQSSTYSKLPQSPPITQQLPSSDRVGIFDANTGQQLVPLLPGNPVTEYLLGATDRALRERSRQGVRLSGQRLKDRTLSEIEHTSTIRNEQYSRGGSYSDQNLKDDLEFLRGSFFNT